MKKHPVLAFLMFVVVFIALITVVPAVLTSAPSKKQHKPTVDISSVPVTGIAADCSIVLPVDNEGQISGCLLISGIEYEVFCIADGDYHTVDAKGRNLREPVLKSIPDELKYDGVRAYTVLDWLYLYHAKIKDLRAEDWLVSFIENRSRGELRPDNVKLIWKSKAVTEIPEWMNEFKRICEEHPTWNTAPRNTTDKYIASNCGFGIQQD